MNERGVAAEAHAAAFLLSKGLTIVERNYRSRHGEIDLIARDGEVLVFVEVRSRKSNDYGGAAASIIGAKQRKLTRTALAYLGGLKRTPPCRFDAVLLTADLASVEWIKDAFQVS